MEGSIESRLRAVADDRGWLAQMQYDAGKFKSYRFHCGPVIGLGHEPEEAAVAAARALIDLGRLDPAEIGLGDDGHGARSA